LASKLELSVYFYLSLLCAAALFIYQHILIKDRNADQCLKAFKNNHWVGAVIFLGLLIHYIQQ